LNFLFRHKLNAHSVAIGKITSGSGIPQAAADPNRVCGIFNSFSTIESGKAGGFSAISSSA
jgi:hypothetical protein